MFKKTFFFSFSAAAVEAQAKALRDQRRREDEEARGTRFGQEILDSEFFDQDSSADPSKFSRVLNDEEVKTNVENKNFSFIIRNFRMKTMITDQWNRTIRKINFTVRQPIFYKIFRIWIE